MNTRSFFCFWLSIALAFAAVFSVRAQPRPTISSFNRSGVLVWTNITPGHYYAVETNSTLTGPWNIYADNLQATSSTATITVPVDSTRGFYRIVDRGVCCSNTGGSTADSAVLIGSYCGDRTPSTLPPITGCGPAFFRVVVEECSSQIRDLQISATLTSPSSADYDLYLSTPGVTPASSTLTYGPDTATQSWNDPFLGGDDTRTTLIEIRRKNAFDCANWTLSVTVGH